jgi:glucose/arabinose dehydrogenase
MAGALTLTGAPSALAGPPEGFSLQTVAAGLDQPTAFAFAPDGRVFVAEKAGRVVVVSGGSVAGTFIDLRDQTNSHLDRGLIGLALDPDFAQNRRVYLSFTEELRPDDPDRAHTAGGRLIRVAASAANGNVADLATRVDMITDFESQGETHSVGGIRFGSW